MKKLSTLFFIFCLFALQEVMAQDYNIGNVKSRSAVSDRDQQAKLNYVKLNLTALPLNNYSLQYERILNRRFSAALSGRLMPESGIPFKSAIIKKIDQDDQEMIDLVQGLKLSNYAVTPEIKIYAGKGYGQGFYVSFFYRYSSFDLKGFPITYDNDGGTESTMDLSGTMTSHTGGLVLGLQKNIGKFLALDLWFLGPHAGAGKATLTGTPSTPFSAQEQESVKDAISDLDIPMLKITSDVSANKAVLNADGPWAGVRMGISLGVRF